VENVLGIDGLSYSLHYQDGVVHTGDNSMHVGGGFPAVTLTSSTSRIMPFLLLVTTSSALSFCPDWSNT
jgi:hypothetical protein